MEADEQCQQIPGMKCNEKALIVFSINVGSLTLFIRQDSRIHSKLLLFGSIIALLILLVSQSLLSYHVVRRSVAMSSYLCGILGRRSQR